MIQHQDLTIFDIEDDDVPLAGYGAVDGSGNITTATFSTDPAHARPYLKFTPDIGASSVNFITGGSTIGQMSVEVVDKRRVANDQDTGIFTYLMVLASGDTAFLGVRVVFRQQRPDGTWEVVFDGTCGDVALVGLTTYKMELRDPRERERITRAFNRNTGTMIWPRIGPLDGWGYATRYVAAGDEWEKYGTPVMKPISAVAMRYVSAGLMGATGPGQWMDGGFILDVSTPARLDYARSILAPLTPELEKAWSHLGQAGAVQPPFRDDYITAGVQPYAFHDIIVEWSANGVDGWQTHTDIAIGDAAFPPMPAYNAVSAGFFFSDTLLPELELPSGERVKQRVLGSIAFHAIREGGAFNVPAPNQVVYVRVRSNAAPTKEVPLFIEERFGTLVRKLYDGEYSKPGTFTPVRYDAAAMAAMERNTEKAMARIEAPIDNVREWIQENAYAVSGYAPAIIDGRVFPIRYAVPDVTVPLLTLNNANTVEADWSHGTANVVNQVTFEYEREFVPSEAQKDVITITQKVILERDRLSDNSQRRHGTRPRTFKPVTFRSVVPKKATAGPSVPDLAELVFQHRAEELLRRLTNGAQIVKSKHHRTVQTNAAKVGDWAILSVTWLPDYATRERGISRLMQIVNIDRSNPGLLGFDLLDSGPYDAPIATPTIVSVDELADGAVEVAITGVVAGGKVEVQYAIGEDEPAENSGEWVTAGYLLDDGTIQTPPQLPDSLVWVRARGVADGRRPSVWVYATDLRLVNTPRLNDFGLSIDLDPDSPDYGNPVVRWDALPSTGGVRILYEIYTGETPPSSLTQHVDFDADDASGVIPEALDLEADERVAAQAVPYAGFAAGAVTGSAGLATLVATARPGLATVPWGLITGKPTTLAGYGITAVPWAYLTGTPTTIAGYGIVDFYTLGNAVWARLDAANEFEQNQYAPDWVLGEEGGGGVGDPGGPVEVQDEGASVALETSLINFTGPGVTASNAGGNNVTVNIPHTWAALVGKPTDLAGYGLMTEADARYGRLAGTNFWTQPQHINAVLNLAGNVGLKFTSIDSGIFSDATYIYFGRYSTFAGLKVEHANGKAHFTEEVRTWNRFIQRTSDGSATLAQWARYQTLLGSGSDTTPTFAAEAGFGFYWAVNGTTAVAMRLTSSGELQPSGSVVMTGGWNRVIQMKATYPVIAFNSNASKVAGIGYDYSVGTKGAMRFWIGSTAENLIASGGVEIMNIQSDGTRVTGNQYAYDFILT